MFAPMIMPLEAYAELHTNLAMPLPLPKPQVSTTSSVTSSSAAGTHDLHYMCFEEAVEHPVLQKM